MGAQNDAQAAIFDQIKTVADSLTNSGIHPTDQASTLRDLALAYRHLVGGAQPGGTVVHK